MFFIKKMMNINYAVAEIKDSDNSKLEDLPIELLEQIYWELYDDDYSRYSLCKCSKNIKAKMMNFRDCAYIYYIYSTIEEIYYPDPNKILQNAIEKSKCHLLNRPHIMEYLYVNYTYISIQNIKDASELCFELNNLNEYENLIKSIWEIPNIRFVDLIDPVLKYPSIEVFEILNKYLTVEKKDWNYCIEKICPYTTNLELVKFFIKKGGTNINGIIANPNPEINKFGMFVYMHLLYNTFYGQR
jgi:hypothetical protein